MKIFGVLAILSTLYTQGTTIMCNKVDDFSNVDSIVLGEDTCADGVITCVRPIFKDGAYETKTDTVKWGCDACTPPASCVSCEGEKCNAAPTFTCLATSDVGEAEPATKSCPDTDAAVSGTFLAETNCVRPKATGIDTYEADGTTWGCGVCEKEENCDTPCTVDDCNKKPEYLCHIYTKADVTGSLWVKDGVEECEASGCRMPTPNAAGQAGEYESCKVCDGSAKTDGICKECTGALCNDIESKENMYCKTGNADAKEAELVTKFCAKDSKDAEGTQCKRPEISYGVALGTTVGYGCGDCTDGEDAVANCETCTESNCNSIPTDKHMCYTYTLKDAKWVVSEEMSDCVSGDDDKEECNMPEDLDVKEGYTAEGCGPCKSEDKGCKVTEPEKNAGERAALSLLVTVLPLLYIML